jgi:hypothetical protein
VHYGGVVSGKLKFLPKFLGWVNALWAISQYNMQQIVFLALIQINGTVHEK